MYEHISTYIADDWKTDGKWEEYKFMIESMHHVTSQMEEKKKEGS